MQPPIPPQTVLRQQYKIKEAIGKGGFGRTYLVEDLTRFNEVCVLKEYYPGNRKDASILKKSKELFQREAQVLYKIDHPQIPKFRAAFVAGGRLFLVQDYVEGKTYSQLLEERQIQGETFTQTEIVKFFQAMLPVLEHIHNQGLIHRDISPDNIIHRAKDDLPVLIDFGVVKEKVAQLEEETAIQATTVGKVGYSPNEQLQTGNVFPNSDIYALAVTGVVLLTGREPQELFDQHTMTWRWQQWIPTLSFHLGGILNRMMSPRPNSRYQSATEAAQALRSIADLVTDTASPHQAETLISTGKNTTELSNSSSGSKVTSLAKGTVRTHQRNNPYPQKKRSSRNSPLTILIIGTSILGVIIIAFAAMIKSLVSSPQGVISQQPVTTGQTAPSPPPGNLPPPPPGRLPPPQQGAAGNPNNPNFSITSKPMRKESLSLQESESVTQSGSLEKDTGVSYKVFLSEGQRLNFAIIRGEVTVSLFGINQQPINSRATNTRLWQGTVPKDGTYFIEVDLVNGVAASEYELEIGLEAGLN
ncbi:MAG: serine/threonine-protein kinase [Spirulinaceae cyanobacterium]